MATIKFETGQTVNFEGNPTPADIEEVAMKLGISKQPAAQPKRSFLSSVSSGVQSFFPGQKVGQSIGTLAGYGISKLKGTSEHYDLSAPTPLQVAGDVAEGALTIAGFKGAGTAGKLLPRLGKTAALGAGFGASSGIAEGESAGNVAKRAAIGAGVGAGLTLGGAAISKAGKFVSESLPKHLISHLHPEKDITQHVLKNTKVGSTQGMIDRSNANIKKLDSQINGILKKAPYKNIFIDKKDLLKSVAQSYGQTGGGGTLNSKEIEKIILKAAPQARGLLSRPSISISDANRLRKMVDNTLGAKFFLKSQAPFNKEVLGSFNTFLRNWVKDTAKETIPLFAEESKDITLKLALQTASKRVSRWGLADLVAAAGGLSVGNIPGAIGVVTARRVASAPATTVNVAKLLSKTGAVGGIVNQLAPAVRTSIFKGTQSIP